MPRAHTGEANCYRVIVVVPVPDDSRKEAARTLRDFFSLRPDVDDWRVTSSKVAGVTVHYFGDLDKQRRDGSLEMLLRTANTVRVALSRLGYVYSGQASITGRSWRRP